MRSYQGARVGVRYLIEIVLAGNVYELFLLFNRSKTLSRLMTHGEEEEC